MSTSRRSFLCTTVFSALTFSVSGCTLLQEPAPFLSSADFPDFRPRFPIPFSLDLDQLITVRFSDAALAGGAPENMPELRARLLVKPDAVNIALLAMNFPVWRLSYSTAGLQESRHGLLDRRVAAQPFLRDLTFCLWPEQALRDMLADSVESQRWKLRIREHSRTLCQGNRIFLDMKREGKVITLINYPEGYILSIRLAD